ncbi:MAG: type II/IV secretion system protein [Planctomycetota bacterium]|nr:MAG: type II/IV secretion system protein [Planctomycetota bacterium]
MAVNKVLENITDLVNDIIIKGIRAGCSDIHIEAQRDYTIVRHRVDGILKQQRRLPVENHSQLVSRIKIMANLNINEHRNPQDGRIPFYQFDPSYGFLDLRVSTVPMMYGEKICLRLIDNRKAKIALDKLGFTEDILKKYKKYITKPHGLILHVGPTGSGKTTSLYAALNEINRPTVNIHTIEDPVEYLIPGLNQAQVNPEVGYTFPKVLRAFLRQDPDVIMVGEIRDLETASLAVEASLTGHLIFSTLHTNNAVGAVTRFFEMGISPFFIASAVLCVVSQRLIRRLCEDCKEPYRPSEKVSRAIGLTDPRQKVYRPKGCPKCNKTGYRGRTLVIELLEVDQDEFKQCIYRNGTPEEMTNIAIRNGMKTLFDDGMQKAKLGWTSIEEVLRVVRGVVL